MPKKQDQIISKTQRFWVNTNKYGIRVLNNVKEASAIDKENGKKLWWYANIKINEKCTTCLLSLGETKGRSTNRIQINQVSHDI